MAVVMASTRYKDLDTPFYPDSGLSLMEEEFVAQYLVLRNGTQSAIRAGYAERGAHVTAARLLRRAKVQDAIRERRRRHLQDLDVSAQRISLELARIAFADVRNLMEWSEEAGRFVPSIMLNSDEAAAISEVATETLFTDAGPIVKSKLKLHSKVQALRLLGQMTGDMPGDGPTINVHVHEVRERINSRIAGIATRIGAPSHNGGANGNGASGA